MKKTIEINLDPDLLLEQLRCVERYMVTAPTAKDRELLEGALAALEHIYDCLNPIPM